MFSKNQFGLTLIETTIALGILMIGILATLTLMLSSFNYVQRSEQEIIVVNLAREGIEIVRSMRNSQTVDLFSGAYDNNDYIVDVSNNFNLDTLADDSNVNNCANCRLYLLNNRYLHEPAGAATVYKRMVAIQPSASTAEKIITTHISWTIKGKTYNYSLETHLTDWQ